MEGELEKEDGDNDEPKKPGTGLSAPKKSMRAITRDWVFNLENQKKVVENTKDVLDEIKRIIQGEEEVTPEMSKQLERLETQFDTLTASVTDIRVNIGKIDARLESIEKNAITRGQAAVFALLVGIGVFGGGWWIVQQYLAPLLAK